MERLRQTLRELKELVSSCSGAALVEWTLVLPFLLTLGLGFMEFGRAIYQYNQIASGLRDAGRYLARMDVLDATVLTAAEDEAQRLATTGSTVVGAPLRVSWWVPGDVDAEVDKIDNTAGTYRGGATIGVVRLSTSVQYDDLGLLDFLGLGPLTFTLVHEERVIRE